MSDKLDVTIGISADASGVEAGVGKAKKSIQSLGGAAKTAATQIGESGKVAGSGFGAIGTGAARSAKEVERATRSMQQQLQRQIAELSAGGKATREYTEALARMRGVDTRALAPLLDQLDQARKKTDAASSSFSSFKTVAASALTGLSAGAFISEITSITRETALAAMEVERFSALSNTTAKDFQRLAAGANTVGISAEKMADIFKDVQDKVGDFVQTGGGGMADFFERVAPKVGVTAENFRKLSGKDALQLYVSSLEKANLAHSDMVFFMEAIASDSSLLLPLLKDQGQTWQELGDRAEAYGAILDGDALVAAKAFKTESDNLELSMKGLRIELAEGLLPSLTQFTAVLSDPSTRSALSDLAGWIGDVAVSAVELSSVIGGAGVWGWLQTGNTEAKDAAAEIAKVEAQMAKVRETRDALERAGGGWMHVEDIALANSQLATMEAKLRGLQVMARQYQAQQAAALKTMGRSVGLSWLESYVPEAERPQALSPAYLKPAAKSSALKAEEGAYKSLTKSIADLLEQQNLEIATGQKLTSAQKLRLKVEQEVAKSKQAGLLADIDQIEANEAWLKNSADVERSLEAQQKAREQSLKSARDTLKSMRDEEEALAYAEAANISLAQAKAELAANQAALNYQQAIERQEAPATLAYYEEQLRLTNEIAAATGKKEVREANKKAADEIAKTYDKVIDGIGDGFYSAIVNDGASALQALERVAQGTVLRPMVQYAANNIAGAMGLGPEGSASSLSNAASMVKNGHSVYSALTGSLTYGLGSAIAGMGTALGASAATSFGAGMAASGFTAGAFGTGASMVGAGATSAGLGMMAGAAMPWVAGALALYSIAKSFDDSGTLHYGAGAVYSGGKLQTGADIYNQGTFGMGSRGEWNANAQQNASGIAASLGAALDGFAVGFGQKAGYTVATAFADDSSDDGAWGSLRIADALGNALVDWENSRSSKWAPKEFASGDEGYQQYLNAVAVDVKSAFLAMDIPAWGKQLVDAATDLDSLSAALAQVGTVKTVLDSLGKSLSMFADLSGDAQTTLLNTSGGIDALAQNAGSFYQGFYTEQERYENSLKQMQEVLAGFGVSIDPAIGDRAKAEFRAVVESAFASGQGELGAQLLAINQQFAAVADYAQKAGGAIGEVADVLSDVMRDLLDDRKSLEADLLRAQGDQSGYLAAVRAIATAGYAEAEIAAWDYNTALQSQIDALDAAAAKAAEVAQERAGLERQLLQLQGDTTELRRLEFDALDPANRSLQEYIYVLQDQAQAAQLAAAVAQERAGLERQLLQQVGDTAAIRALERAALDESNRALYDRITALQDEQIAAQKAAQAVSGAWANLGTASGWAAQHLGDSSGLHAQMGMVQASYQGATTVEGREAALGQIIALEQSIWQVEEQNRQAAAQAAQAQAQALQGQLSAVNSILGATQRLREYAEGLFTGAASGLSDAERLDVLAAQYSTQLTLAKGGDVDAMGKLQGVTGEYLTLAQQLSGTQSDYSVLSGRIAAELASTAVIQGASAKTQADTLQAQIDAANSAAQYAGRQFEVSAATKELVATQLKDAAKQFETEMTAMQAQLQVGMDANLLLEGLPVELTGVLNSTLVPVIGTIADAAMAAASMSAASAEAARQAAASASAAASAAAAAAIAAASKEAKSTIPGFASGGSHMGGLRIVGENGPELEATGPSRIWNQSQLASAFGGNSNAELVAEIRALRKEVADLKAPMERTAVATSQHAEQFDSVSAGGNALAMEVMK